jgi:type IV pilus assembly protein PilW
MNPMLPTCARSVGHRLPQRGVTLVELMVGLVIGMICTVIVAQVLRVAEGQKRSATEGSDAQVNGALSLYTVQRDVSMAGYGFAAAPDQSAVGCDTRGASATTWTLAPVLIIDGAAAGAPDKIRVTTAVNANGPALWTALTANAASTATDFEVNSLVGIRAGDLMVAVPKAGGAGTWCSVFTVDTTSTVGTVHHVAASTAVGTGKWSPSGILPAGGYASGSYLVDVGQLEQHEYSVDTARYVLQQATGTTASDGKLGAASDLYPNIVNLQAMYGKDTDADGVVDTYDNTTPATAAGWAQVLTVRLAIVARSGQRDKEEVTTADPQWDVGGNVTVAGANPCGATQCVSLSVQSYADWKHYRYKVYDMVVPLRNVLWKSKAS